MQFIPLYNMVQMLRLSASPNTNLTFKKLDGTNSTLTRATYGSNYFYNIAPFGVQEEGTPDYTYHYRNLKVYASSADVIPASTTSILDQVGTTAVTFHHTTKGWEATISVTAVEGSKIKSFLFTKGLIYNTYMNFYEAVIFAIKLDNTVTIDSTGTANFTFAIEF